MAGASFLGELVRITCEFQHARIYNEHVLANSQIFLAVASGSYYASKAHKLDENGLICGWGT